MVGLERRHLSWQSGCPWLTISFLSTHDFLSFCEYCISLVLGYFFGYPKRSYYYLPMTALTLIKHHFRSFLLNLGLLRVLRRIRTRFEIVTGKTYDVKIAKTCASVYVGSYHAGYSICPTDLGPSSVIYSFGLGDDISFDLELIEKYGCKVFGADPTPKSLEFLGKMDLPYNFKYFDFAIADYDGVIELFFPKNNDHVSLVSGDDGKRSGSSQSFKCLTIASFMNMLGHSHVDLIKIDIKGPEFAIIPQIISTGISFNQLIVEFTPELFPDGNSRVIDLIHLLASNDYYVFDVSDDGRNISVIKQNIS